MYSRKELGKALGKEASEFYDRWVHEKGEDGALAMGVIDAAMESNRPKSELMEILKQFVLKFEAGGEEQGGVKGGVKREREESNGFEEAVVKKVKREASVGMEEMQGTAVQFQQDGREVKEIARAVKNEVDPELRKDLERTNENIKTEAHRGIEDTNANVDFSCWAVTNFEAGNLIATYYVEPHDPQSSFPPKSAQSGMPLSGHKHLQPVEGPRQPKHGFEPHVGALDHPYFNDASSTAATDGNRSVKDKCLGDGPVYTRLPLSRAHLASLHSHPLPRVQDSHAKTFVDLMGSDNEDYKDLLGMVPSRDNHDDAAASTLTFGRELSVE